MHLALYLSGIDFESSIECNELKVKGKSLIFFVNNWIYMTLRGIAFLSN